MDKKLEDLLREEIENQIEGLPNFESGSEEKLRAIKSVAELYKLKIDEDKAATEADDKAARRDIDSADKSERRKMESARNDNEADISEREMKLKERQLTEQNKERYTKIGIAAAELVLPLMFYAFWMNKGFKFEKDGTFTSTTFRGLFNRFRPTK